MRIPLDYYRILGLPIQATAEQLHQAHRDRIQQLPRHEFSEAAIAARKQLIDQAYATLSDGARRQEYDASFLAKSYDLIDVSKFGDSDQVTQLHRDGLEPEGIDPYTPNIEIDESQFVGALLSLLELGEYELVLRLGHPYLSSASGLREEKFGDSKSASTDIVLTVALAYLELGREQWQQGQYENAAVSLENGQELLLREQVFVNIRSEMQSDLFKLRPYRILELVSLPNEQEEARRQGISLLGDMLHDRNGIDGNGDDWSGLGVDDFLRFIQQLRSYLTSAEQQVLFEAEARRPSAVAMYLAVYALLARGFAQRQPALIRRAKMLLLRLGNHQDVHLEQAVCSLLLGQTEEASRALGLSQEFEALTFIRDHSQGSPDQLPGLCLYSERWFQNEVFPHFRDLQYKQASLTEYFADEDVQLYLEDLPNDAATLSAAYPTPRRETNLPADSKIARPEYAPSRTITTEAPSYAVIPTEGNPVHTAGEPNRTAPNYFTPEPTRPLGSLNNSPTTLQGDRQGDRADRTGSRLAERPEREPPSSPPSQESRQPGGRSRRSVRLPANLRLDRILMLAALGLLGLMLFGFLFGKLLRPQTRTAVSSQAVNGAQTQANAEAGFAKFAQEQQKNIAASAPITKENAPEIIKSWLGAKAAAMGESHDVDQLSKILADPALGQIKTRAVDLKSTNSYWKLDHPKVEVVSVSSNDLSSNSTSSTQSSSTPDASSPSSSQLAASSPSPSSDGSTSQSDTSATIEALVSEKAEFYANGRLDNSASYNSTVRMRYGLERQNDEWRIRSMDVLQ